MCSPPFTIKWPNLLRYQFLADRRDGFPSWSLGTSAIVVGISEKCRVFCDTSFPRIKNLLTQKSQTTAPPWQEQYGSSLWMPYSQMKTAPTPIAVERTQGVRLYLSDGRELVDGLASWWSACHGYNHPHLISAIQQQASVMPHVMFGGVQHEPAARLAHRLAKLLPDDLDHVFFCDSGSVAVEVAMKMAIQFYRNRGTVGRTKFVSFANAYHGDTTGAMSLCDPGRSMHAAFGSGILSQINLALPQTEETLTEFETCLEQQADSIAAVFIEPIVQGAGGMRFHDAAMLSAVAESCKRHDVLLIADELATGFGRTGKMFAVETAGVCPDLICLGKALTGGVIGMAATVATKSVFDQFWSDDPSHALMHGPTFMANPLACAAANASLDLFETQPRLEQVHQIQKALQDSLSPCRDISRVVDVRVKGAIGVIQVDHLDHVDRLRSEFIKHGVWIRPFGDCIYITPPLVIEPDDLRLLTDAMGNVTRQWAQW